MTMNDDVCGAVGGVLGKGNRSNQRNPTSVKLCLAQIPHDQPKNFNIITIAIVTITKHNVSYYAALSILL
jgi:hypothetical protein